MSCQLSTRAKSAASQADMDKMLSALPARLSVLVGHYAAQAPDEKQYIVRAVNERDAVTIVACLEQDVPKVKSPASFFNAFTYPFQTRDTLAKRLHLSIDLSQDYSITQRDPLQLYHPMPSHLPEAAFSQIETFSICEPYLWRYADLTAKPHREHNFLRRWTITFRRRYSLLQQRSIWATEVEYGGEVGSWESFELPASSSSPSAPIPPFPSRAARESQWMLQDEILPKIQKTLKIFNDIHSDGRLTAEMMWLVQNDMKFWTWMGEDKDGVDLQEWDRLAEFAYGMRGRDEAARVYRSATRKGAEGVWRRCKMG
ncbi:hypothetical protein CERZMDRAFT_103361 [Cercospora zeae-maydis SCOH1-5]|uniref:Uncharacterized protein n=1 Tax=Cercospora zeae-maydis SCOH1-5 TaxID=717836 RepID=A0A6A6EVZ3_9PEZI|nr:hypothetical protein CERZMDRAFT_103361 [Cercospora zeae-maydis SCOH1-5]